MAGSSWQRLLDVIRRRADPDATGPLADERLLARFVANGDPSAFELLVWRHGSLVYGTCRRVLGDLHSAEDAFQATFLALARKPRAVRNGAALAGWLHRVALRIANKLRVTRARQSKAEQAAAREVVTTADDAGRSEVTAVVDEEIDRLPERLRRAAVLCYLDGRTTEQAAAILGCPRGTVLSRLSAARDRLRDRLTRRGFTLPVAGIVSLIACSESPATLVPAAVRAALTGASPLLTGLVQGVFHAMLITKVRIATAVVLGIGFAGAGVGWVVVPGWGPAVVQADEAKKPQPTGGGKILTDEEKNALAIKLQRSFDLFFEAQRTLNEKVRRAEQEYQDFRAKNPFQDLGENPRARMDSVLTKRNDLRLKNAELESRLAFLKAAIKPGTGADETERAARTALLKLQLRGVDIAAMRKAIAADGMQVTAAEFVRNYSDALQSEIEEIQNMGRVLSDISDNLQKQSREMSNYELQDERLRNTIMSYRTLFDAIVKRVNEINLVKDDIAK